MIEGSGSGSIPLTKGSGSRRPKNTWIRIRIRKLHFTVSGAAGLDKDESDYLHLDYDLDTGESVLDYLACHPDSPQKGTETQQRF